MTARVSVGRGWWVIFAFGVIVLFVVLLREQWATAASMALLLGIHAYTGWRRR